MSEIIRAFCSVTLFILRADAGEDISPGWQVRRGCGVPVVHVKNFADALRQGRVDLLQAVGAVFMFGRHNLERFHFLQLIQTHLTQNHQASVNKYLHFPPYLLLSSESIVLTADWSSGVHL